jgi:hypothetical protein
MNKKIFIIIAAFMVGSAPVHTKSIKDHVISVMLGAYLKVDEFKNRIPLEQLSTVVHDDLKNIMDLLVGAKEHVPHNTLYRLKGLSRDLLFDEEIGEIESYLRPFIPEAVRYNGVQLNNWRWFFRGVNTTATALVGSWMLYHSKESRTRNALKALGVVAAGYLSYRLIMVLVSRMFNFASNREFLKNAQVVFKKPLNQVPDRFYDFHQKYQPMTKQQLLEAFNQGHFVKDIVEALMPVGM